jgi:death on curing protein
MTEPEWLDLDIVIDFHAEQLALFGGPDGIRDVGLLESALGRAQNKFAYGEVSLAVLAAAHGFGIARNHPFVDGNKRTAWIAARLFLQINGTRLSYDHEEATRIVEALAAGKLAEAEFAEWLRKRVQGS